VIERKPRRAKKWRRQIRENAKVSGQGRAAVLGGVQADAQLSTLFEQS